MDASRDALESTSARRLVIVALIIAALAPYAATLGFGYVLDDTTVIRSNPALRLPLRPFNPLSPHAERPQSNVHNCTYTSGLWHRTCRSLSEA